MNNLWHSPMLTRLTWRFEFEFILFIFCLHIVYIMLVILCFEYRSAPIFLIGIGFRGQFVQCILIFPEYLLIYPPG
jgi:hypothetical protein